MPLLSFSVLRNKLDDESKLQTIRVPRKHPIKEGDKLYIYWKCRTKETEKLGEGLVTKVEYKNICELTNNDAKLDGFEDGDGSFAIHKLAMVLHKLHPDLNNSQHLFKKFAVVTWKWTAHYKPAHLRSRDLLAEALGGI
jgi:hypothetical protein